jgi:hypothetical protein
MPYCAVFSRQPFPLIPRRYLWGASEWLKVRGNMSSRWLYQTLKQTSSDLSVGILVVAIAAQLPVYGQNTRQEVIRLGDGIIEIRDAVVIPEASEPCTPAEAAWWERIRSAYAEMLRAYKKRKAKAVADAKRKFWLLLHEGEQNAYRVPLQDRPPLVLLQGMILTPFLAIKHATSGTLELSVEYRKDGSVGDIDVITWLGDGWTQNTMEAVRQNVFLPAVKDRKFVDFKQNDKRTFTIRSRF